MKITDIIRNDQEWDEAMIDYALMGREIGTKVYKDIPDDAQAKGHLGGTICPIHIKNEKGEHVEQWQNKKRLYSPDWLFRWKAELVSETKL